MNVSEAENRARELVAQMTVAEKISQLMHNCPPIERLGLSGYCYWNEGLHGVGRAGVATVFPAPIALAASFDTALIKKIGKAVATEARAKFNTGKSYGASLIYQGVHLWAPNVNIARDPRWGRTMETYGEDPYLTQMCGTAYVRGLQSEVFGCRLADATVKHYVCHSGPENARHGFNAKVSEKDFYETYARAFAYIIENAEPAGVMGAYNAVNGKPCCASELVNGLLRGKFGFDGYFVSDCGALCDLHKEHKVTFTLSESAALALKSGCDLNCGNAFDGLKTAYECGLVSEKDIDVAAVRVLKSRFTLGTIGKSPLDAIGREVIGCKKHKKLALKAAKESIVLLKNNGILPLDIRKEFRLAVVGCNADNPRSLLGNYNGTPYLLKTPLRAFHEGLKNTRITLSYAEGCKATRNINSWDEQPLREAVAAVAESDVVIAFVGFDNSSEGEEGDAYNSDAGGDRNSIELFDNHKELIAALKATGKPLIVVNHSGAAAVLPDADAVIQQFYGGECAGEAIFDCVFGKYNPSGRLPVTFYASDKDLPDFDDYSMAGRTYRFFEGRPPYPFGYGLSYSDFLLEDVRSSGAYVTAAIRNPSEKDGETVVMFYSKLMYENAPLRQLTGFRRLKIKAGSRAEIRFRPPRQYGYGPSGERFEIEKYKITVSVSGKNDITEKEIDYNV